MKRPWFLWLAYGLIGLAVLAFVWYFVVYNVYAAALFRFPFDYEQGEGFELMNVVWYARGETPYRDTSTYPFFSTNYAPVFHLIILPLVLIFGPQYWTGRLVSYLGTLITASAIGYAVHRESRRWWLAVISGLAFLASNYIYHVGPLFRQHLFMVMLETVAVVWLTRTVEKEEQSGQKHNWGWLVGMILLLLAGYTKQLAYATIAAAFIFLFLRQWKRAIAWAIGFVVATGLVFVLLYWLTDGYWFISAVASNINRFVPGQTVAILRQFVSLHPVLVIVAALFAVYQFYFERLSLYSIWFVLTMLNGLTAGKWGAGESYYATAIAAACLLSGVAFHRWLTWVERKAGTEKGPSSPVLRPFYPALALVLVALLYLFQADRVFHMPTHTPFLRGVAAAVGKPTYVEIAPQTGCSDRRPVEKVYYVDSAGVSLLGVPPNDQDTAAGQAIAALVAASGTPSFSEDAGFNFYTNQEVLTNPPYILNLFENNLIDLSEMITALDQQSFGTVILRSQFYPYPVLQMIGQRYETNELIEMNGFVYCIMFPRGES
ncbi:MAG: DUF2029 domain-containing protein [Chloroflexi bacterium]|nr:DUF2029 domain-containing protein [Chloroflexota bacterium]MBP8057525.1 DUF2029 domain-containing protein [Chloroflexota bacterium]